MQRRTFLQTLLIGLVGPGWPATSRANRSASPAGPDFPLCALQATYTPEMYHLLLGLGWPGVSACRRFADQVGSCCRVDCLEALDPDDLPAALGRMEAYSLCLLILETDNPRALEVGARIASAIHTQDALLKVALALYPPGTPWQWLAEEKRLTELRAKGLSLVLVPNGEVPGEVRVDPRITPMQTLRLFSLAPSLISHDFYPMFVISAGRRARNRRFFG